MGDLDFKGKSSERLEIGPDSGTKLYFLEELSKFKDAMTSNFIGIFGLFTSLVAFLGFGVQELGKGAGIEMVTGVVFILFGGVLTIILSTQFFLKDVDYTKLFIFLVLIIVSFSFGIDLLKSAEIDKLDFGKPTQELCEDIK